MYAYGRKASTHTHKKTNLVFVVCVSYVECRVHLRQNVGHLLNLLANGLDLHEVGDPAPAATRASSTPSPPPGVTTTTTTTRERRILRSKGRQRDRCRQLRHLSFRIHVRSPAGLAFLQLPASNGIVLNIRSERALLHVMQQHIMTLRQLGGTMAPTAAATTTTTELGRNLNGFFVRLFGVKPQPEKLHEKLATVHGTVFVVG